MIFDVSNLRRQLGVAQIFADPKLEEAWRVVEPALRDLAIPDGNGGVNPGDRRAIFYLALHLQAQRVLEIGTHVGASTTSLACALRPRSGADVGLDTVDVRDVNDPERRPWIAHGTAQSPREMITGLGLADRVQFVVEPAAAYLESCEQHYDLIFLDGDHEEPAIYAEIVLALRRLRPDGVILLHDYFPEERPLWSNGAVCPGPYRAVQHVRDEGAAVRAVPLGELPWPTKCGSTVTSLAILLREDVVDSSRVPE